MSSSPCAPRSSVLHDPIEMLSSSPPPVPSSTMGSRKPKKPPPITPRRLTRFFTPRTSTHSSALSKSGRQLQDITRSAVNRTHVAHKTTPRKTVNFADVMVENSVETPKMSPRKRKTAYLSPETSPVQSSPTKRYKYTTPPPFTISEDAPPSSPAFEEPPVFPLPIRRLKSLGGTARKLERSFGGILGTGRGLKRDHCSLWQDQTANFYSGVEDLYALPPGAPPFCTAACNTNSLVAVGDEEGYIHLLDTDDDAPSSFSKAHVSWRAHSNAVMDVQFSSDDAYIATASGDQTAQIVDVRTQQTIGVLAGHKSSVKQVRFQPGNDKVVATSSRDGAVQIWDLRYKSGHVNVHSAWGDDAPYVSSIRTFAAAHADTAVDLISNGSKPHSKGESYSRRNDISVTALSFLSTGREHLLLTASDASTSIKLWDIRGGRYSLRGPDAPISTTRVPESHARHRNFAINSLTLGGDASRLYALSKDNTVYAYSTSHLVLGFSPDLSLTLSSANQCQTGKQGLGPLYGFRHRNFHAGSFYVKAALRKASNDQSELLAVGSTDGCPVLFPTDENFLKRTSGHHDDGDDLPEMPIRSLRSSLSSRSSSGGRNPSLLADDIPIYEHGTSLIRGHEHEVTSVSWSQSGTLVSVSDDHIVRRWKEGDMARHLRQVGETEGKRWQCGWAEVGEDYDDEE